MAWLNRFRQKADNTVVHEFTCTCAPDTRSHGRMVDGATINMNDGCYLEDGVAPQETDD